MENESLPGTGPGVEENEKPAIENEETTGNPVTRFARKSPVLFTALVGLLAIAIVYSWKEIQARKQRTTLEKMAQEQLMENNEAMLKLVIKPFVWSIRAEMLRENMDQVNIYTNEMVREKNFQLIQLVAPGGKILISTDKKSEGQSATGMVDPEILQADSVIVSQKNDLLTIAAPVMGYDKKLGVLILKYKPEMFEMNPVNKTDTTAGKRP